MRGMLVFIHNTINGLLCHERKKVNTKKSMAIAIYTATTQGFLCAEFCTPITTQRYREYQKQQQRTELKKRLTRVDKQREGCQLKITQVKTTYLSAIWSNCVRYSKLGVQKIYPSLEWRFLESL